MAETPLPSKLVQTSYGFNWKPYQAKAWTRVQRLFSMDGRSVLRIDSGDPDHRSTIDVYVSKGGRSIRVFRDNDELLPRRTASSMAETSLPSREEMAWSAEFGWPRDERQRSVLQSFTNKELMTAEEWRATIDTRAAYKVYEGIASRPELTYSGFLRVFDSAFGDTDEPRVTAGDIDGC